jgi:hypothetical protein
VVPPDTSFAGRDSTVSDNQLSMNTGLSANTNFYGTFAPHVGALRGIRHTITPSATYGYTPSMEGRPSVSRVSVSLKNAVDLKVARHEGDVGQGAQAAGQAPAPGQAADSTGGKSPKKEEQTTKLSGIFLWSLGSSYVQNQLTREFKWTSVSSLVNLRVLGTNLSVSQTIDPYLWEIQNTSLTSSLSLRGTHPFGRATPAGERELNVAAADTVSEESAVQGEAPAEGTPPKGAAEKTNDESGLPWDVNIAFSYSKSKGTEDPRSTVNLGGNFSLTKGWKLTYRTTYDVISREFLQDYLSITRDLHCWEMSFGRQRLGDEWEFYFKIYIKLHPEIFAEQGSRALGGGTFSTPFSY